MFQKKILIYDTILADCKQSIKKINKDIARKAEDIKKVVTIRRKRNTWHKNKSGSNRIS